jgi:MobA/MobL family
VAVYYLGMKTFGRSSGKRGSRATSAAAYRAGERIRDERTGAVYNHHRRDVLHKEIVLPAKLARAGSELDWARNRATLWNAAEHAEVRKNARVAREFILGLPHELAAEQRTRLTRRFAQELADRYGNAVDVAIHAPRGDPRNFHAHLLATTREITPDGLGPKTTLERSGTERHRLGLSRWREEMSALREQWVSLANKALENAHVAARIVPKLPDAERSSREAVPRVPLMAFHIEQRGERSFLAERVRAAHREKLARVAAELDRSTARRDLARSEANESRVATAPERESLAGRWWSRAREAWLALSGPRSHSPEVPGLGPRRAEGQAAAHLPAREAAPQGAAPRTAVAPDDLAREAARQWLKQYGRSASVSAAPRDASALNDRGHTMGPDHQHPRREESGHELKERGGHERRREPEHEHEHEHEHDYGLGL